MKIYKMMKGIVLECNYDDKIPHLKSNAKRWRNEGHNLECELHEYLNEIYEELNIEFKRLN